MKARVWVLLGLGVLLLLLTGGSILVWRSLPAVAQVSPPDGAGQVPVAAPLRLTFSRQMRPETVKAHLKTDPPRGGKFEWQGNTLLFTPDHPWPGGQKITVTLESGARSAGLPGLPLPGKFTWSFTTSQSLLAYLWPANSRADIYALDPLSGEVLSMTQNANVLDFSVGWDGLVLYFSAPNSEGGADLYQLERLKAVSAPRGMATPVQILTCGAVACRLPQPSPDGNWLAYERILPMGDSGVDNSQVWLLNLPTGDNEQIGEEGHLTRNPSWSSNGALAYDDRERKVFVVYNPETRQAQYLLNGTGEPGSWSPDGSAYLAADIFYSIEYSQTIGSSHLMLYDLKSGQVRDLTQDLNLEDATPAFSPDGKMIAFGRKYLDEARWTPGRQLWLMAVDGSSARQITDSPIFYIHHDFAWSLDGRWLAYVRFNQAAMKQLPELWYANADGSNPIQLVIGGYSPKWIP